MCPNRPTVIRGWPLPAAREYVYEFEVLNRAGTYWYHPHPHMRAGAQVYQGLAGLLIVSDEEEDGLGLPSGSSELLCVLQDRRIDARQSVRLRRHGRRARHGPRARPEPQHGRDDADDQRLAG